MPVLVESLEITAGRAVVEFNLAEAMDERRNTKLFPILVERTNIPYNSSSPPGLIEANTRDPWSQSGKYALGWVYFCIILLTVAILVRLYHLWTDKIRTALHKEDALNTTKTSSPDTDYELSAL
ncbi:hypothetical protein LTR16_004227, partial [Cryomyces antarcticus]